MEGNAQPLISALNKFDIEQRQLAPREGTSLKVLRYSLSFFLLQLSVIKQINRDPQCLYEVYLAQSKEALTTKTGTDVWPQTSVHGPHVKKIFTTQYNPGAMEGARKASLLELKKRFSATFP